MNFKEIENKMVFRRDNEYGAFYSIGMSKKLEDGNYENGYMDVRFKKDIELDNMTKINIKESWLTFYLKDEGEFKTTKPYIFINDFEIVEESSNNSFDDFTDNSVIDDEDLPF